MSWIMLLGLAWLLCRHILPGLLAAIGVQVSELLNTVFAWVFVLGVWSVVFCLFFGERGKTVISTAGVLGIRFLFKCLEGIVRLVIRPKREKSQRNEDQ